MRLTNFLKVGAIALLLSFSLASCKKEETVLNNEMSYNNKVTSIAEVYRGGLIFVSKDGITFTFFNDANECLLQIHLSESMIGTKIDLSKADPNSNDDNHYCYGIISHIDEIPTWNWTSDHFYLCGDPDNDPVYADKKSYLLVKKIGDMKYSFDLHASRDGYKLNLNFSGVVKSDL